MKCDCKDWQEGMKQLTNAQMMSELHHGAKYTATQFRYCPWCGQEFQGEIACKSNPIFSGDDSVEFWDLIDGLEKFDEKFKGLQDLQKLIDKYNARLEEVLKDKEKEILEF